MRCLPLCSGCDKPSPGRGQGAILAQCHRKGWLYPPGQREERPSGHRTPLVQRGDRPPQADRGDCEADCIILLGCLTGCGSTAWVQRHAANPSVGVRRQLPLHKGAVFAAQHTTGSSAAVCQDCKAAPTGEAGAPGPSNAYSRGEYGRGGSPQPPLCKGGTAWQRHAGGIVKLIASFCLVVLLVAAAPLGRGGSPPASRCHF